MKGPKSPQPEAHASVPVEVVGAAPMEASAPQQVMLNIQEGWGNQTAQEAMTRFLAAAPGRGPASERASMRPEPKSRMQVRIQPAACILSMSLQWGVNRSPGCRSAHGAGVRVLGGLQWGLNRSPGCRLAALH